MGFLLLRETGFGFYLLGNGKVAILIEISIGPTIFMRFGLVRVVINVVFVGLMSEEFGTNVADELKRSLALRHLLKLTIYLII